ncbi:MAG: ribose-phosphate diphosphokinase [Candidatus Xenobia bacterium]
MGTINLNGDIRIVPGRPSVELSRALAERLQTEPVGVHWQQYPNGFYDVALDPVAVCGYDVFVIHQPPGGLEELLLLLNTVRASKPRRINVIVPYFFYARSDKNEPGRVAVPPLIVDLLVTAADLERLDGIIAVDLHAPQITMAGHPGLLTEVSAVPTLVKHLLRELAAEKMTLVATDAGGARRLQAVQRQFSEVAGVGPEIVTMQKHRRSPTDVRLTGFTGDVRDRFCVVFDDEVATGHTLCSVAELLKAEGAAQIWAAATHGVLCDDAPARLSACPLDRLCVTDSVPVPESRRFPKLEVVPLAPMLAAVIDRVHWNNQFSVL